MVRWKGLTFNASFNYYWGGKVYNQTLIDRVEVTLNDLTTSNVDRRVYEDRWMQPGDKTFFKGSMSLEYRWDNQWLRNMTHLQSITFGVNINNLFYWSSVKQERGIDYPFARNLQGSIRFLF